MLILFDHGAPRGVPTRFVLTLLLRLRQERLSNGALLKVAEEAAFDLLFTTDSNLRYQQNLSGRKIAIVVLTGTTKWSRVRLQLERLVATINSAIPGSYTEVEIPYE